MMDHTSVHSDQRTSFPPANGWGVDTYPSLSLSVFPWHSRRTVFRLRGRVRIAPPPSSTHPTLSSSLSRGFVDAEPLPPKVERTQRLLFAVPLPYPLPVRLNIPNSTELPVEDFRSGPVFSPLFSPVLHTQRHPHSTPLSSHISALYSLSGPAYPVTDCWPQRHAGKPTAGASLAHRTIHASPSFIGQHASLCNQSV